ncbi:MAG: PKD domain-containing protein, partial [Thermoplasmatota archaeon]
LWIDEGCADYAAYLVYDFASALSSHIYQYLNNPYVTLPVDDYTFYTNNNGNDPPTIYYGVSFTYQLYMASHYGGKNWTRALVQRTSRGTSGVNSALSNLGSTDSFTDTFKNWMVATRINDDYAGDGEEYSYPFKSYPYGSFQTKLSGSHAGIPVESTKPLRSWATKTYRFVQSPDGSETYRLKLSVSSGTAMVAFYAERSGSRDVLFIPFTGTQAVYDITGWGSTYQAFQLITASSAVSDLKIDLDILDLVPPVTTAGVSPMVPDGLDGWYKTQPKVTLKTESGADTYYQVDHGEEKHYNAPFYILNGIHNLSFYSVDPRDNVEERHFIDFKVDTAVPSSDIVIEPERPEGDWYQSPPTISLSTDHPSSYVIYRWGSGEYQRYSDPLTAPEGESSLMWKAVDQAGNEESVNTRSFMVDTESPIVASSVYPVEPDGPGGWYHTTPVITLQAEDSSSIYYRMDNGEYMPYLESLEVPDGTHIIRAMAIDQASNQGPEIVLEFNVDTTVPTIWGFFEGLDYSHENSSQWLQIAPSLTITSSELDMRINYTINDGEPIEYTEEFRISEGYNEIRVYGEDRGGNVAEPLLYVVKVDSKTPKADHFIDDEPVDGWYRNQGSKLELTLKEEDEGASPAFVYYKWNGASPKVYKEPLSIPEGSTSFVYWAEDEAGNSMEKRSLEIKKDSVLPAIFVSLQGVKDKHILQGENLTVDLSGSADDSGIAFYSIDYGDGSSVSWRVTGTFTTRYDRPGTYNITAYVKDSAGNVVNRTIMVTVDPVSVEEEGNGGSGSSTGLFLTIGAVVLVVVMILIMVEIIVIMRKRSSHHHAAAVQNPPHARPPVHGGTLQGKNQGSVNHPGVHGQNTTPRSMKTANPPPPPQRPV